MEKMAAKPIFAWKEIVSEMRLLFGPRFDPQLANTDQQVMSLPQTPSFKTQQQPQQQQ
jgi:hypothetical protein